MLPVYIGLIVVLAGLCLVCWLILSEKKQEVQILSSSIKKEEKPAAAPVTPQGLLQRLGLPGQKPPVSDEPKPKPERQPSALAKMFHRSPVAVPVTGRDPSLAAQKQPDLLAGAPAVTPPPSSPPDLSEKPASVESPDLGQTAISTESELSFQHDELKGKFTELQTKHEKLDSLFQEKAVAVEKVEKELAHEIKNRKEFNKVKDILEKELKDSKDKCRELQVQVGEAQTETQSHLKRVGQLEEKIKKLEKEIIEREEQARELEAAKHREEERINQLTALIKQHEQTLKEKDQKIAGLVDRMKDEGGKREEPAEASSPVEVTAEAVAAEEKPAANEVHQVTEAVQEPPRQETLQQEPPPQETPSETMSPPAAASPVVYEEKVPEPKEEKEESYSDELATADQNVNGEDSELPLETPGASPDENKPAAPAEKEEDKKTKEENDHA